MHHRTTLRTRLLGAVVALALGGSLVACSGDDSDSTDAAQLSTTEHNDADVTFASDMIRHHAQALAMVDLTLERPLTPQVQTLAEDIRDAQAPEIEAMADWLTSWGEEVPATMRDHASSGHDTGEDSQDMPHETMPGMMSAEDMEALESATDDEFQDMWLEMMIEHHEGAVEMAEAEQEDGRFEAAVELAGQIIEAQNAEIATMNDLLGS